MQDADTGRINAAALDPGLKVVTWRPPTAEELRSLLFAWRVCKHVKSNAIVYARDGQTLGVGAGQMSRVDAARFGAMKAVLPLKGCVAASDAFFPFPDGLEAVAAAGATAVIQPGGSVKDRKSSPPPTSSAWPWSSLECATSGIEVCSDKISNVYNELHRWQHFRPTRPPRLYAPFNPTLVNSSSE